MDVRSEGEGSGTGEAEVMCSHLISQLQRLRLSNLPSEA